MKKVSDAVHVSVEVEWTWQGLRDAAVLHTARQTERCADLLQAILQRLDSVGADGIHELIRESVKDIRKQRLTEKQKRKLRRVA